MALGYQNPFYLKQAQKKQQSLYDGKMLLDKHDPPVVHDSEETLQLAQECRDKMKQINKEIKPANNTKINYLSGVFVPQKALSLEELYFLNNPKTANVSKSFLIPNEDLSDDTTPSVARKFLNEVKSTILTLQHVVKQRMTIETHNWASSAHQEFHKIVREEIFPIVNQVDARVQNFEIQFLKEAPKFVGDFKSLAKEADDYLAKHKAMELDNECLLKAVVSQDVMSIVKKESVVDTSDLQTELEQIVYALCGDYLCGYHHLSRTIYVLMTAMLILCAGRLLGTYDLGVVTPRAVVYASDKTSGDARVWYMISGDAKSWVMIVCIYSLSYSIIVQLFEILAQQLGFLQTYEFTNIIVDVFEYHFQVCFDKGKWMVLENKDVHPWGFEI
nr:hypothetical protein [Tanacetum cinerariifolium]